MTSKARTMITYAQNFEDVILARTLSGVSSGTYIDVGAWHPTLHSVTKHFYDAGWSGVNIDPGSQYWDALDAERPRDTNLNCAISIADGEREYYEVRETGWSGFDPAIVGRAKEAGHDVEQRAVRTKTLRSVCEEFVSGEIHFLKIDVEGAEAEVIASGDWDAYRPWIVVVEAIDPVTRERANEPWALSLAAHGYTYAYFDGLNEFYVRDESRELIGTLAVPPNLFDDFISVRQAELENSRVNAAVIKVRRLLGLERD